MIYFNNNQKITTKFYFGNGLGVKPQYIDLFIDCLILHKKTRWSIVTRS